jgi:hypothetical protein
MALTSSSFQKLVTGTNTWLSAVLSVLTTAAGTDTKVSLTHNGSVTNNSGLSWQPKLSTDQTKQSTRLWVMGSILAGATGMAIYWATFPSEGARQ